MFGKTWRPLQSGTPSDCLCRLALNHISLKLGQCPSYRIRVFNKELMIVTYKNYLPQHSRIKMHTYNSTFTSHEVPSNIAASIPQFAFFLFCHRRDKALLNTNRTCTWPLLRCARPDSLYYFCRRQFSVTKDAF